MFEKEAEEYANEWLYHVKDLELHHKEDDKPEYTRILEAHQKGADFGYKKANEWHYPSKGEYPKDVGLLMSKTLLLITKMKGSDCLSLALGQYNFSTQEFSYQHIVGLTDVIAWKEIVFPELPKESE